MRIETVEGKSGVMCDCGKHRPFDGYYYAHTGDILKMPCECGRVCKLHKGQIVSQKTRRVAKGETA